MTKIDKILQHRPDSLFSWVVSVCSCVCQALNLGFALSFGVLLPELMKEFGESRQKTVWVGSLAIGLTFFLGSLGSLLCQTIGCRFTSILGCLVCAVSLLVTPHSTSLEWMFLTYGCVFGIGSALMLSSYFLITAKNFRRWQSLAVGIVTVGGSSGLLIMGPLLQLLIDIFGWRGTYRILSIPFFVMACVCGVTFGDPLPDTSEDLSRNCKTNQCNSKLLSESEGHPEMEMNAIDKKQTTVNEERKVKIFESECQTETQQRSQIRSSHAAAKTDGSREANCLGKLNTLLDFSVFKIPCYTVAVLSLCLMKFGHFIPQIHMVNYCLELGISADSASRFFIPFGLLSSVARVVTGRICDVIWVNTTYIYQFGALLDGFAVVVLPVIRNYTGIQVFAVIYGIADGVLISTMNSLLMFSVDEKRRAAALGLGNSLLSLAIASGPPFAVWVGSLAIGLTFFLGPLGSLLCQTVGCRFTSFLGCIVCAVSLLITPYSSGLEWMFLTYGCVFGTGSALMLSSYFLITAKNFRRWQSLAVGIVTVGGSSGLLIMGPSLQLLIDIFGWRVTYRIISVPFFLMAIVSGVAFVEPIQDALETTSHNPVEKQSDPEFPSLRAECPEMGLIRGERMGMTGKRKLIKITDDNCPTETQETNQVRSFEVAANTEGTMVSNSTGKLNKLLDFSVFKIPSYTLAVISLCLMNFGHFIPQIHMVNYCLELGISADSASWFFIPFGLSSSLARFVTGRICDVIWVNTMYIYQFGALLDGFAIVVLPVVRNYVGIQVFAVIYGIGDGIFITTMNSLLMFSVDEKRRAAGFGLGNTLISLVIASGSPFAGFIIDTTGCYTWAFFTAGIVTHVAGLVPLTLFCLKNKKDDDLKKDKTRKLLL
nr:uncharacterized protein LOC131790004 [Pocillopora verrucosa]